MESGQLNTLVFLLPEKESLVLIGGWLDPRVGLDAVERRRMSCPSGIEPRILGYPIRSLVTAETCKFTNTVSTSNR
jgi:hypothetical protein